MAEDIIFGATALFSIQRYDQAIDKVEEIFEIKNQLDPSERNTLFALFKGAIDPSRASLRTVDSYYQSDLEEGKTEKAELLLHYKNEFSNHIISVCQHAIDILENTLIPNAEDPSAQCFYYKFKADMYRYIAESDNEIEKDKALIQGKDAYMAAIEIATNQLEAINPTRLGVILNAAVFRYKHLNEHEEAIEMLQQTSDEVKGQLDIPEEWVLDVQNALKTMKHNLDLWCSSDYA